MSDLKGASITRYSSVGNKADDALKFPEPANLYNHVVSLKQSSVRGREQSSASTLNTTTTTNTTNTKTTESSGPYSRDFQQKLIDGCIYPDEYEYSDGRVLPEPDNLEEIGQTSTLFITGTFYAGALGARGMHSLQSYGEDEPVHDNNAYTITSIYSDGQLKMYTSHLTQPLSFGVQPEYCMSRLGAYAMTHNREIFCQAATAYRNARDWTKEQRDKAIRRANERANDSQVGTSAVDASFGGISSFTTEASLDKVSTIKALS